MEIIVSLNYDPNRHSTVDFVAKYFKKMSTTLLQHSVVDSMISDRSILHSIESIISADWKYTKMVGSMVAAQVHHIDLIDEAWVHVYLLVNANRDKLVMYVSGQRLEALTVDLGYIGDKATFDKYLTELTVSEIEAYTQILHLIED